MNAPNPGSLVDRFVGVCLMFLVGAAAISIGVRLIEAVWSVLLVIGMVVGFIVLAIWVARYRSRQW